MTNDEIKELVNKLEKKFDDGFKELKEEIAPMKDQIAQLKGAIAVIKWIFAVGLGGAIVTYILDLIKH